MVTITVTLLSGKSCSLTLREVHPASLRQRAMELLEVQPLGAAMRSVAGLGVLFLLLWKLWGCGNDGHMMEI